jgi:hypothetical protein
VNIVRTPHGNYPPCGGGDTGNVSRERRALSALAVLFGLAVVPALLLRGHGAIGPARPARAHAVVAHGVPDVLVAVPPSSDCLHNGIPLFPRSTPAPELAVDQNVAAAINRLHVAPTLTGAAILQAPFQTWAAGMQHGRDLLSFYAKRMHTVNFWDMNVGLRNAIGVRPRGTVDSPPLLYVNHRGAVLLRPHDDGSLDIIVMCPSESA